MALSSEVSQSLEPSTLSDEDALWRIDHVVVGADFNKRTTVERYGRASTHTDETLLRGLRAVDDLATRALADAALADHVPSVPSTGSDDEARVRAIPGALADYGLGEALQRAQRALAQRVRRYGDPVASALLRTLVQVARARPDAAVISAYARACLLACFEPRVPELSDAAAASTPSLAPELRARERDLRAAAEAQEDVDALQNARSYRSAADALHAAAELAAPAAAIVQP